MNAKPIDDAGSAGSDHPFVRDLAVASIPTQGFALKTSASPAERQALARLAGIRAVERFDIAARIVPHGERFQVTGELSAEIVQNCVVTLDDFASSVKEPIDAGYASLKRIAADIARHAEEVEDGEGDSLEFEPDEPILSDGAAHERLDIGRLVTELFILSLDPYPRKPGVKFQTSVTEEPRNSPFAQLAALKDDDKSGN